MDAPAVHTPAAPTRRFDVVIVLSTVVAFALGFKLFF